MSERITVRLSEEQDAKIQRLVNHGDYINKSALVRDAIRQLTDDRENQHAEWQAATQFPVEQNGGHS